MKLIKWLVIVAVYIGMYHGGGIQLVHDGMKVIGPEVTKLIETQLAASDGNVNSDAGKAASLITNNGSNWENISRTISSALNPSAK